MAEAALAQLQSCIARWDVAPYSYAVRGIPQPTGQPHTFPFVLRFSEARPSRPVADHYVTITAALIRQPAGHFTAQFRGS